MREKRSQAKLTIIAVLLAIILATISMGLSVEVTEFSNISLSGFNLSCTSSDVSSESENISLLLDFNYPDSDGFIGSYPSDLDLMQWRFNGGQADGNWEIVDKTFNFARGPQLNAAVWAAETTNASEWDITILNRIDAMLEDIGIQSVTFFYSMNSPSVDGGTQRGDTMIAIQFVESYNGLGPNSIQYYLQIYTNKTSYTKVYEEDLGESIYADNWFYIRYKYDGTNLSVKTWLNSTSEPDTWNYNSLYEIEPYDYGSNTNDYFKIYTQGSNGMSWDWSLRYVNLTTIKRDSNELVYTGEIYRNDSFWMRFSDMGEEGYHYLNKQQEYDLGETTTYTAYCLANDSTSSVTSEGSTMDIPKTTDLRIVDIIPIQVVTNVPMIKGKTGYVLVNVSNEGNFMVNATVTAYFDGQALEEIDGNESGTENYNSTLELNPWEQTLFNFTFKPEMAGDRELYAEVVIV